MIYKKTQTIVFYLKLKTRIVKKKFKSIMTVGNNIGGMILTEGNLKKINSVNAT